MRDERADESTRNDGLGPFVCLKIKEMNILSIMVMREVKDSQYEGRTEGKTRPSKLPPKRTIKLRHTTAALSFRGVGIVPVTSTLVHVRASSSKMRISFVLRLSWRMPQSE